MLALLSAGGGELACESGVLVGVGVGVLTSLR